MGRDGRKGSTPSEESEANPAHNYSTGVEDDHVVSTAFFGG